ILRRLDTKRLCERMGERRRCASTIEHAHHHADRGQAKRIATALVTQQSIPAIRTPKLAAPVHSQRRRASSGDDDNAWTDSSRACPCANHVVLEDRWASEVENAKRAL